MSDVASNQLPDGWAILPVKELGKAITGNTPPTKDPTNYGGDIPFVKPTELVDRPVSFGRETISEKGAEKARILPEGGVLVSCIGNLGKTAIAKRDVAFNQQINAMIFNESVIPEYGFYYFQTAKFRKDLESLASATTISIVNKSKFESINVPVAPPEQQKRIVAKIEELFSHIDAGIEGLKKAKQLLKQYRQSVLKAAVTGELTKEWREANKGKLEPASQLLEHLKTERKKEFDRNISEWEVELGNWKKSGGKCKKPSKPKKVEMDLDISKNVSQDSLQIPDDWIKINLDFAVSKLGDGLHGTPKYSEGEYYFINGNNLSDGKILIKPETKTVSKTEAEIHHRDLNDRTVLVSINGTLGNIAFYDGENVILGKSACYFNILPSLSKYYIRWILESNEFKLYAEKTATGSTIKNVPLKAMREFIIPLCSESEQNEIVRLVEQKLSSIDHLDAEINQQLVKAERNKQSVLSSAFSGEL